MSLCSQAVAVKSIIHIKVTIVSITLCQKKKSNLIHGEDYSTIILKDTLACSFPSSGGLSLLRIHNSNCAKYHYNCTDLYLPVIILLILYGFYFCCSLGLMLTLLASQLVLDGEKT